MVFRGSIARRLTWLSTLRRGGRPPTTQDSLPAAGPALPDGIGYPQGSLRKVSSLRLSSFPELPWRKARSSRKGWFRKRDGGHYSDDAGLRPGVAGAAGSRLGPRLLGDGHGDRGLGVDGVRAPLAFPGSTDTATFQTYVEQVLVPELHEGDVVVFDNLKPHLAAGVATSIEGAGAHVLPLPPYSPDYTPIEEMFSKVKQGLRRAKARTRTGLYDAVGERSRVTPRTSSAGSDMPDCVQHQGKPL